MFVVWDVLAIRAGHWAYDPRQTTGIALGDLPLEELLFFLVIPVCAVLTLEAVRAVKGWRGGRRVSYTTAALLGVVATVLLDLGCCAPGC